jgi:hypothetical protein
MRSRRPQYCLRRRSTGAHSAKIAVEHAYAQNLGVVTGAARHAAGAFDLKEIFARGL